jgi:hypothetical protein
MLRNAALLSCFALAILAGCAQERPVIIENRKDPAETHTPAGNAIEAIKSYGYEQRDLTVNNLQGVLSDLDKRIRDMRDRSKSIASDSRKEWNESLTELEKVRDELEVNATRLKFATQDTWDDVKHSTIKCLEDVQESLQELQEIARE